MGFLPPFSSKVDDVMALDKDKSVRFCIDKREKPARPMSRPSEFGGIGLNRNGDASNRAPEVFPEDHDPWSKGILDPGGEILLKWNRVFLVSCLVALFVDPLFFYTPSISSNSSNSSGSSDAPCVRVDRNLNIVLSFLRTIADLLYVMHIAVKFRTAYVAPSSRVFGRGELVMDKEDIARRYLRSGFIVDFVAALPLPQIVIWIVIPAIRSVNTLALIILLQYVTRVYLIFPLSSQIIRAAGVVTVTAWIGAAYNLILYMLASHVLGASWYLLSIERQTTCWKSKCYSEMGNQVGGMCYPRYLDCRISNTSERSLWAKNTSVFRNCDAKNDSMAFEYGIFGDALVKGVVSTNFPEKFLYCLWWGLQNLSSYGQGLSTTSFAGETAFAILIAIMGLVLFAHLIGNMQTYLQSITVRLEEWRLKQSDTEEWMRHRQLPRDLRDRIRKFLHYKWLATHGVNEEFILQTLPADLRRDIQRHLCLDLVRRMDDQLLDAICERLMSCLSTEGTYIFREGDPVTQMFFIHRGKLESSTTNGGRTGFFNSIILRPGDFCGEELLAWALVPNPSSLPSSTRTVEALSEVEGFALRSEDLRFVANQFRRLHSKKLQQTFRFYSPHWRTWAACFIQAAWRRFKRRKLARELNKQESFSSLTSDEQDKYCSSPCMTSIPSQAKQRQSGATISGSKFAATTRMAAAQWGKGMSMAKLQKPEEPDFSVDPEEE